MKNNSAINGKITRGNEVDKRHVERLPWRPGNKQTSSDAILIDCFPDYASHRRSLYLVSDTMY